MFYSTKLKKFSTFLVITFIFISMCNASEKIILEDYINSFSWDKRIVLLIINESHVNVLSQTDEFFASNSCENESRKLEYIFRSFKKSK